MNHLNPFQLWVKPLHPDIKSLEQPLSSATPGSAGLDLRCIGNYTIQPGGYTQMYTGLAVWIQTAQLMGMIAPRSSLGKKGFVLQNTVGIIDSDYQGELILNVFNRSNKVLSISHLDRVAQLIIVQIANITANLVVDEFPSKTERESGAFGSTGMK